MLVVIGDKPIDLALELCHGTGRRLLVQEAFERLVKAFDLSAGLRMVGPRMFVDDAHLAEQCFERRHTATRTAVEDRTIVSQVRNWIVPLMKSYPNDQMVRYTHDWVLFDEENSRVVFCARTHMADPGDGSHHSATSWTRLDYAGDGLFRREEDIYNIANFVKLLENWQAVKGRATT